MEDHADCEDIDGVGDNDDDDDGKYIGIKLTDDDDDDDGEQETYNIGGEWISAVELYVKSSGT